MVQLRIWAGILAGILSLVAFVPYIIAILRGKIKPNRASWWIWTVMGLVLGLSYYSSGANGTIWVPVSYFIGPLVTAILSIRYGEGGWTKFDRVCIFAACVSTIPWVILSLFFHSREAALPTLIIGLCIDFAGAVPTIRKAYREPESEDRLAWSMFFLANILNVVAIDRWTLEIMVYPVYMMLGGGSIAILVLWPRRKKRIP